MSSNRFFLNETMHENETYVLKDGEFHHLHHVMRFKKGDVIYIIDGQGTLAKGYVQKIEKNLAYVTITSLDNAHPPSFQIILMQAYANTLDDIVEKATELGATEIWLFPGEKSERKVPNLKRLQAKTIAATKQCNRLFLPKISLYPKLKSCVKPEFSLYYGSFEEKSRPLITAWQTDPPHNGIIIAIGPEKGFSEQEVTIFHAWNGTPIRLHDNTLRTETASLSALAMISMLKALHFS